MSKTPPRRGKGNGKNGKTVGKGVGKRRRAREMAVQMLYQQEQGGATLEQVFQTFDVTDYLSETAGDDEVKQRPGAQESFSYARRLVEGTRAEQDEIDDLIRAHAENWRLERMPSIDRNILRLALYEMLRESAVPKVVIVDEAIELAKRFGSENSGRFVNGLLDGVLKSKAFGSEG
ncbi:MAG: transcription antitermination factor NusB [Acidobacteriota bacterium]